MPLKKIIKSKSALKSLAVKKGATLTSKSGAKFNSAKKKITSKMPEKAKLPPKTASPDAGTRLMAETIEKAGRSNAIMIGELIKEIRNIQLNAMAPITEWDFYFIRNKDGSVSKLEARAPKVVIN